MTVLISGVCGQKSSQPPELASSPGPTQILSRSRGVSPRLRDKIWVGPGDEATLSSFSMSCSLPSHKQNCILCTTQRCKLQVFLAKDINNLRDQFFYLAFQCTFSRQQHGNCSREWLAILTLCFLHIQQKSLV